MYLVNVDDVEVGWNNAVNWLKRQDVDIISSSIILNNLYVCKYIYGIINYTGFYFDMAISQWKQLIELQDQVNYIASNAVSEGITWVQAANNNGRQRWEGFFNDLDNDGYHNFASGYNDNELILPPSFTYGKTIYVNMVWGNDGSVRTYDDYDLSIINEYGYTVASSILYQSDIPFGMEACKFTPIPGRKYFIKIRKWWATPQSIGLIVGTDTFAGLEEYSPERTVRMGTPCANPDVLTVGAVPYYNTSVIEDFSGQGPGDDDVIKPDLVAPDGVSTVSYGTPFYGTSAAAPHVAGVCALVKQMYPHYGPVQIKNYLESNARDLGSPGKDNVFGSGLVQLPLIDNSLSAISAQVTNFKFFESPNEGVPFEQRDYSNSFEQSTTRYIAYELHLEYPSPRRLVEIPLNVKGFYPDGSLMGELSHQITIQPDWTSSYHSLSWGWSEPGNWEPGTYTVRVFEDAQEITNGTFTIIVPDTDGDGVSDDKDNCPGTPAGAEVDVNGCSTKGDLNKDGIIDLQDSQLGLKVITLYENSADVSEEVDGDGKIDLKDTIYIIQRILEKSED